MIELIIFSVTFGGFICGFILLMSYNSGWSNLAQHYKTNRLPTIVLLNEQSGCIGGWLFKKALNIGVSEQRLYLSTGIFASFFNMPPLLIPWDAVTHVRHEDNILWGEGYQLDIGTPTITTLTLPKAALQGAETILVAKQL